MPTFFYISNIYTHRVIMVIEYSYIVQSTVEPQKVLGFEPIHQRKKKVEIRV